MIEIYSSNQAKKNWDQLLMHVSSSQLPVCITNDSDQRVVMMSEMEYRSMQETLAIMSVPGLAQSIIDADKEPRESYSEELPW